MGAPLFPGHQRLHALAHRRSICHPSSAIRHPLWDPPVERGSPTSHHFCFVFGRNILYMQMHCHGHCFVVAIPSRGNVPCAHKCRSSAKLPELRSSRRRRCCIRQAATDGAGLGRCQPPSTPSHRPQQAPYEVRLTTCGGKCTTPPIQKPLPCLDPRPEDPKLVRDRLDRGLACVGTGDALTLRANPTPTPTEPRPVSRQAGQGRFTRYQYGFPGPRRSRNLRTSRTKRLEHE